MVKIKKYANGIERFMSSPKGQRFFNFAYSIGAAVVIWGALFKILHLPGGSTLLCIGMGTEIAMFIITAFDRPPKEYAWEEVFPVLDSKNPDDRPDFAGGGGGIVIGGAGAAGYASGDYDEAGGPGAAVSADAARQAAGIPAGVALSEEDTQSLRDSIAKMAAASDQLSQMAELTTATQDYLSQLAGIAEQMTMLRETTRSLNEVSSVLLHSYRAITQNSDSISQSAEGYADRMADLNRNIGGLNTIYEIQLKSISSQLESIDRVNRGLKDIRDMYEKSAAESAHYCEETEKMARYMKQLNSVYEKMITAMTINMCNPMMGGAAAAAGQRPDINPFAERSE
ncbi:MAG: gliding motility protein GldL [Muribaculaceae bacterium]|nr:gliding motility protein GldL [Muribaculaceae bacterium]MDE5957689.1 gliding motility protein GldL [Muribaculaceae bacterium]